MWEHVSYLQNSFYKRFYQGEKEGIISFLSNYVIHMGRIAYNSKNLITHLE